jgi:hypothetical protein
MRPHDVIEPRQLDLQHLFVKKQQRSQRLILRGGRHPPLYRQIGQKGLNLRATHLGRVSQPVKADEALDPSQIGFFSPVAEVFEADPLADKV